ncbi:MAG TPA: transcriptional repressor [Candidatus Saccharimonadales bacterium]|nr:transcriptional repressor [Candidatus Saccharimonadales bacterium]
MERNTSQRRAIQRVLQESARPMGPREILEAARRHIPGIGIATVYRTLKRAVEEGSLAQVDLPGEPPRYEMSGRNHHPYFRCRSCNRVFGARTGPKVPANLVPPGFQVEGHALYLYGLCSDCVPAAN